MFPPIPQNCTVIETPLSHLVPVDDMGTVEEKPVYRCIPKLESNVIRLYALGNTSKVSYRPVCIAPGVDTHAIHDFNVSSGWTLPDERTEEERAAESIRTSISRSVRLVRELAACNPWQFFVTITLSPEHWQNRYTPDGLQDVIKQLAKRWRRKHKNRSAYCPDFKYLFVPEMHKNGAIHLHGFVSCMPSDCIPYTLEQVSGSQRLPKKSVIKSVQGNQFTIAKNGKIFSALILWSLFQTWIRLQVMPSNMFPRNLVLRLLKLVTGVPVACLVLRL